jgi:hypothetical protein
MFASTLSVDYDSALAQARLVFQPGEPHEVAWKRPGKSGASYKLVVDPEEAANLACHASEEYEATAVWLGFNPARAGEGKRVKDVDIIKRTTFILDFDTPRAPGFKNEPATDSEKELAHGQAHKAVEMLRTHGFPDPLILDSGNGVQCWYRVDLQTSDPIIERFLKALKQRFALLDTSVHNPSRIGRFAGTMNRKGTPTENRPHRMAEILSAPEVLETVPREKLEEVIGEAVSLDTPPKTEPVFSVPSAYGPREVALELGFTIKGVNESDGIKYHNIEERCPFKDHVPATHGNAGFYTGKDGIVKVKCHHEECQDKTLADLYSVPDFFDDADNHEAADDPSRITRGVLRNYWHPRWPKVASYNDDTYTYEDGHWQRRSAESFRREVTRHVKAYINSQRIQHDKDGKPKPRRKVTRSLVNDVLGIVLSKLPEVKTDVPCWFGGLGFPPEELVVFSNCILHYPTGYILKPTPRLFALNRIPHPYEPDAPKPQRWLRFLNEIWPNDPASIDTLQEWFGYELVPCTRYQQYLVLQGAARAGKGTIIRIDQARLGKGNYAAAGFESFADTFALEEAIGKLAVMLPEARNLESRKARARVAEKIKAITGQDAASINQKYIRHQTAELTSRLTITTNERLDFEDESGALHARMLVLKFANSFAGREDPFLTDKLCEEMPGILNWSLDGLRRLRERGRFAMSQSGLDVKQDLQRVNAPVRCFIAERCSLTGEVSK